MATYAAVVSLLNTVDQIQNHAHLSTCVDKKQTESVCSKLSFLLDFLERNSRGGMEEAQVDLERRIRYAAFATEDLIESHVEGLIRSGYRGLLDLQKVIEDMDSLKEKIMQIRDMRTDQDQSFLIDSEKPVSTSARTPLIGKTNVVVGFEDELIQIMERLTRGTSSRQVIPIVGMGGIGKTTLARCACENPCIENYFDIQIWVTISQNYTVRDLLLQIPFCQSKQNDSEDELTDDQLGDVLYKNLSGQRYLIIMDDMWSIEVWNRIKIFFPDTENMSRILVTTRLSHVANNITSRTFRINFLDEDNSWKLFCETVFKQEACPPELENTGKKIVQKCKGLPLTIVVIGGLLSKTPRMQKYWENVAQNIISVLNSGEEVHCLNVLSLSYSHLSAHLKPCFLYMGIFPEDYKVKASQLIKFWIAEGFLKPNKVKSLEEVAEDYLKDLVDRNIILVHKRGLNGRIKTCYIHDLLRDLCLRIATEEGFFGWVTSMKSHGISCQSMLSLARSHIKSYSVKVYPEKLTSPSWYNFNMHVLNVIGKMVYNDIFLQVNLRFISYSSIWWNGRIPPLVSQIWNLQTLICNGNEVYAPVEIWEMQQLRHVECSHIHLQDPPVSCDKEDNSVLKNLHTLMNVVNFRWSEEVLKKMPCIKKLKITYNGDKPNFMGASDFCLQNLCQFQKLESLHVDFDGNTEEGRRDLRLHLRFPCSLRKLSLGGLGSLLCWDDLTMFGLLPHLEVLKLQCEVKGTEWNPNEGEFFFLKYLNIDKCEDLVNWNVDSCHIFPVLEKLHFGYAPKLEEIPSSIGDIPTLKVISLCMCRLSAAISAMNISNQQESFGNKDLQVRVIFNSYKKKKNFRAQVELQGLASNNFHVKLRRKKWAVSKYGAMMAAFQVIFSDLYLQRQEHPTELQQQQ